jgi:transglutaminase-like putative cysteine protease
MLIRAGYTMTLECAQPMAIHGLLNVHPDRIPDLRSSDNVEISPFVRYRKSRDAFGNDMIRVFAPAGEITFSNDFVIYDDGTPDVVVADARQHPVPELPQDTLQFLLPSRYCDSDVLSDLAWKSFGGLQGWGCVQAICDFAHDAIRFDYALARNTRCASDSMEEKVGVCRDYAHLAIALCRAMNIPARYCTGYLGDIGIPPVDYPMDFSAWFEVYLEGRWFTFDARHNVPRIGRIVMARGRDAADVSITHSFGASRLTQFSVVTDELVEPVPHLRIESVTNPPPQLRLVVG